MIICKDHKIYSVIDEWEPETQTYLYDEQEIESLVPYLGDYIRIVRNFTFGDLWQYIVRDAEILETIFASQLGHHPLAPYIEESRNKPEQPVCAPDKIGMHYLVISWDFQTNYYEKDKPQTYLNTNFGGYGTTEDYRDKTKAIPTSYSLSFSNISDLCQYDLKLDTKMKLHSIRYYKPASKTKTKKMGKVDFSLYNVISSIMFEISFFGLPSKRDEEKSKIDKSMEEIDSGEAKTYTMEEVKEDFKALRKERNKKDKAEAPELISQYQALFNAYNNDPEHIEVKRFYMTHRGNKYFCKATSDLRK